MSHFITEAWVLYAGERNLRTTPGELRQEVFRIPEPTEEEILIEPILGCWEGNMTHAVQRSPIDVALQRNEPKVVLGNSGVVRVLKGSVAAPWLREGDLCMVFSGPWDKFGYMPLAYAYDAPNTYGVLAKRTKLHYTQLLKIPANTRYSVEQWAAFSLRYMTAWSNWQVAFGAYRLQMNEHDMPSPHVWGWGGGSTLAELSLAKLHGCNPVMLSSKPCHLHTIECMGISAIDFNAFAGLDYDEDRYMNDEDYREKYLRAERAFLQCVDTLTAGMGVSIFVDYVGSPVTRASLRALGRQGVITTAGWKKGMKTRSVRAIECIQRHIHVHTHYARLSDGPTAVAFAEHNAWLPLIDQPSACWEEIPRLADAFQRGSLSTYFPLYKVNAV